MTDPREWTVRELVAVMADDLRKRGIDGARLDAELVAAEALGLDRVRILIDGERLLAPSELDAVRALFKRRRSFEPVAYLRGFREFYGRPFRVDRRVLVPRPDTEILVAHGLELLAGRDLAGRVLDLCTGSGCVGISLKLERPTLAVDLTDVSREALSVARDNAQRLGAVWNVSLRVGDLFAAVPKGARRYDLITANPPYIPSGDIPGLQADVRDHEPHLALDGGPTGLALVGQIVEQAPAFLCPGGALALEVGSDQADAVVGLFAARGFRQVRRVKDYGGHERVISAVTP